MELTEFCESISTLTSRRSHIVAAYEAEYKDWKHPVNVTQTVPETFGGTLAVIKAIDENGQQVEEMCFVFDNRKVQIFQSTEQLAIFLDSRARLPWYQRVFATSTLSGIVFVLTVILIFLGGIDPNFNKEVVPVLGSVVGAAAGFYFGSSRSRG